MAKLLLASTVSAPASFVSDPIFIEDGQVGRVTSWASQKRSRAGVKMIFKAGGLSTWPGEFLDRR